MNDPIDDELSEIASLYVSCRESYQTTANSLFEHIHSILDKKFRHPHSVKARCFLRKNTFPLKLNDTYVVGKLNPHRKNPNKNMLVWDSMTKVVTSKGTLYVSDNVYNISERLTSQFSGPDVVKVFTGHFFDRYTVREGKVLTRDQAIEEILTWSIKKGYSIKYDHGEIQLSIFSGIGLGNLYKNTAFIKTYISDNEMRDTQKNDKVNLEEEMKDVPVKLNLLGW